MAEKVTVPLKSDGDLFKATEVNDITSVINANADELTNTTFQVGELTTDVENLSTEIQELQAQIETSLGGVEAVLTTASPPPTVDGLYALNGAGTYTNLGGIVLPSNTLGYVLKSGNTYSPIFIPFSLAGVVAKVADANVIFALKDDNNYTYGYVAKDLSVYIATDKRKRTTASVPIVSRTNIIAGTEATSSTITYLPQFFAGDGSYYTAAARKPKDIHNRLKGRRIVILSNSMDADRNASTGDSLYNITASVNSRWAYLRDRYGAIIANVDARRSTSMAMPSSDLNPPTVPYVDDSRLLVLQGNYQPSQIDIVIIGDVVNDLVGRNVPLGQPNSTNKGELYGASNYLYNYLTTTFYNAKIVQLGIQRFHRAGDPIDFLNTTTNLTNSQVNAVIEAQCKKYDVYYLDMAKYGFVTYNNATQASLVPDGLHPSGSVQYSKIGPILGAALNQLV